MVKSVNGDHGSSVIPISGDDWLFLSRGKHVWLDNQDVHMSGTSGNTLTEGIAVSETSKKNQAASADTSNVARIKSTVKTLKLIVLDQIDDSNDYIFCCGGWSI